MNIYERNNCYLSYSPPFVSRSGNDTLRVIYAYAETVNFFVLRVCLRRLNYGRWGVVVVAEEEGPCLQTTVIIIKVINMNRPKFSPAGAGREADSLAGQKAYVTETLHYGPDALLLGIIRRDNRKIED